MILSNLSLTEKWGPFPIWAYIVLGGGGFAFLLYKSGKGGGTAASSAAQIIRDIPFFQPSVPDPAGGGKAEPINITVNVPANPNAPTPGDKPVPDPGIIRTLPNEPHIPLPIPVAAAQPALPAPAPAVPTRGPWDVYGTTMGLFKGVETEFGRLGNIRSDGTFEIRLSDTKTWQPFGKGIVDLSGKVTTEAGQEITTLNKGQMERLLANGQLENHDWGSHVLANPVSGLTDSGYGETAGLMNGLAKVFYKRSSQLKPNGQFEVTVLDPFYKSAIGKGFVDALGAIFVGNKKVGQLDTPGLQNLLMSTHVSD